MDSTIPAILIGLVLVAVLALMLRSWRARTRRDVALTAGYPLPGADEPAAVLATAEAFYVATTREGRQLERLNIRGLGFRARALITVTTAGVLLDLVGENPVFIPTEAVTALEDATWTIDRAVETGGLLLLRWRLQPHADAAGQVVDSYFRILDPTERARVSASIRTEAAGALRPAAHDESEA
ncbi:MULTISPECIES: hypothetical protein [unclassified Cryobacterium]|uniref:PH-like domain-containing protein n=1 Tax=unclassified Cryobacterium TaxID=2649013 RepID=UPI002AB37CC5|nr:MULTISPECIES: hypothetical protein [unclassified Cryobacterium]MDY7544041.1 hypothetical protein [Cryobacterium sp. 5B3]MEA9997897.1 hypothetical protein [Cryobacterium sp. RTS3]MEB0265449.1 hypothetical protein [Cryobacterium sp. 10I5]MEB0273228.1 hypothetical protein [Cryobacterium sp. 5B3]